MARIFKNAVKVNGFVLMLFNSSLMAMYAVVNIKALFE